MDKSVPSISIETVTENLEHMVLVDPESPILASPVVNLPIVSESSVPAPPVLDLPIVSESSVPAPPVLDLPVVPIMPIVPVIPIIPIMPIMPIVPVIPIIPIMPIMPIVPVIPVQPVTPGPWITSEHLLQLSSMLQGYMKILFVQKRTLFDLYRGQKNMVSKHILPKPMEKAQLVEHIKQYRQHLQTDISACYSHYMHSQPAPSSEQMQNYHTLLIWQVNHQLNKYTEMVIYFEDEQKRLYQYLLHLMTNGGWSMAQSCEYQRQLRTGQVKCYHEILRYQCLTQMKQVQLIEMNINVPEIDSVSPAPTCGMKCMMCRVNFELELLIQIDSTCNCCISFQCRTRVVYVRAGHVHRMWVPNGRVVDVCESCAQYQHDNVISIVHTNNDCVGRPKPTEEIVRNVYPNIGNDNFDDDDVDVDADSDYDVVSDYDSDSDPDPDDDPE